MIVMRHFPRGTPGVLEQVENSPLRRESQMFGQDVGVSGDAGNTAGHIIVQLVDFLRCEYLEGIIMQFTYIIMHQNCTKYGRTAFDAHCALSDLLFAPRACPNRHRHLST